MKTKITLLLLIAAFSFAGCKKTGEGPHENEGIEGKNAALKLKITRSKGLATYAAGDPNATLEEITINRVDVFIFDNGAPFGVLHTAFTDKDDIYEDFTNDGPEGDLKDLVGIPAKTGTKRIYVGINLTTPVINKIMENYAYLADGIPVDFSDLVAADGSLAMFNETDFEGTPTNVLPIVESPGPGDNEIDIRVSRLVAKAAVKTDPALELHIPGGTLSDLTYSVGQTNNKLHIAPLRDFQDVNWDSFLAGDFNLNAVDAVNQPYQAVAVGATYGDLEDSATPKVYLPENTSSLHRHEEVSYISIKAKFTPTADALGNTPGPTPIATGDTFIAVFTSDDPGTPGLPGIGVHYFHEDDAAEAETYRAAKDGVSLTYQNGECYYRIYLNPDGDGLSTGRPYDILRNVFYKVNITKINTIGTTDPDQIPGATGTPGFPGGTVVAENPAVLPGDAISPAQNTNIAATIQVVNWDEKSGDYEF
jgi:hypothetical protein